MIKENSCYIFSSYEDFKLYKNHSAYKKRFIQENHTIDQIDAALLKIKNKTYGVCGPSSRRINVDRLMAIPWTDVCVDCKSRSERRL